MADRTIKLPIQYREAQIERAAVNPEKRTVELSFSSEAPVERFFGYEILDHADGSPDLSRLNGGGAFLMDHNTRDQIGVVESARIQDRRGKAIVRLGNSTRATEIFQDIKDGIRRLVSVGYRVNTMITEKVEQGVETMRATSWTPMEISLVSVPADPSVGIGRGDQTEFTEVKIMSTTAPVTEIPPAPTPPTPAELGTRSQGITSERNRVREINAIADRLKTRIPRITEKANTAITEGMTLEQFREECLANLPEVKPVHPAKPLDVPAKEWTRYSLTKAISSLAAQRAQDGFEREMDDEMSLKLGQRAGGIWVPPQVFSYSPLELQQRNFIAGTGTLGGMLVETSNLGDQFIELLRNKAQVLNLGARILNLDNPVTIPRQNAAGSTNWVAETVASTLSTGNFTNLTLTPFGVSAFQQYSKQLLATNNPSIDMLIRDDIVQQIALAVDLAALHGTGSGQPTGLALTTGVGTVALAASGQALANSTAYPAMVSLETTVAAANADIGSMAYLMRAGHRGALKTSSRFANSDTPVWETNNTVNGYRAAITQQISTVLTTGTATTICSAIFFGNWAELILAQFNGGATDLIVDPYSLAANAVVRVIARRWVDIGVRHPAGFCILGGILTT